MKNFDNFCNIWNSLTYNSKMLNYEKEEKHREAV